MISSVFTGGCLALMLLSLSWATLNALQNQWLLTAQNWQEEWTLHQCGSLEAARRNLVDGYRYLQELNILSARRDLIASELIRLNNNSCHRSTLNDIKPIQHVNTRLPQSYPNWHYQIILRSKS